MATRKPFTKRERHQATQNGLGDRPVNNWGDGDLPAPWAEGDVVRLCAPFPADEKGYDRLRGMPHVGYFVVTCAFSIDEGDAWYFRVWNGVADYGSDRLHVAYPERCAPDTWDAVDWMAPFELVETADPDGLVLRERMIADGWSFAQRWVTCPTCGNTTRVRNDQ